MPAKCLGEFAVAQARYRQACHRRSSTWPYGLLTAIGLRLWCRLAFGSREAAKLKFCALATRHPAVRVACVRPRFGSPPHHPPLAQHLAAPTRLCLLVSLPSCLPSWAALLA